MATFSNHFLGSLVPLYKLASHDIARSVGWPELAMGVQIVHAEIKGVKVTGVVLGDLVFMTRDEKSYQELSSLFKKKWQFEVPSSQHDTVSHEISPEVWEPRENKPFFDWWEGLPLAQLNSALTGPPLHTWLSANYTPPRPARPSSVYGHLPYNLITRPTDIYYRYEAWPVSRRIDPSVPQIRKGTFACPASERAFVRCGFGAVGRYALPDLMPACWRWELKPKAKTHVDVGACVPLYGQAGGGVEVYFRRDTPTRGPIALPKILPIY